MMISRRGWQTANRRPHIASRSAFVYRSPHTLDEHDLVDDPGGATARHSPSAKTRLRNVHPSITWTSGHQSQDPAAKPRSCETKAPWGRNSKRINSKNPFGRAQIGFGIQRAFSLRGCIDSVAQLRKAYTNPCSPRHGAPGTVLMLPHSCVQCRHRRPLRVCRLPHASLCRRCQQASAACLTGSIVVEALDTAAATLTTPTDVLSAARATMPPPLRTGESAALVSIVGSVAGLGFTFSGSE